METLPEKVGNPLPATFDLPSDLTRLLSWDDDELHLAAERIGTHAGPVMEQVRRAVGAVAWAAWHRYDDAEYKAFVDGLAAKLFVTERTIRNWRDALTRGENALDIPGKALARQAEAKERATKAREDKGAGQVEGVERPSTDLATDPVIIETTATEVENDRPTAPPAIEPDQSGRPADTGGAGSPDSGSATDGEAETAGDGRGDELVDALTPQRTEVVNPPDIAPRKQYAALVFTTGDRVRAFYSLLANLSPAELWHGSDEDQRETLTTYINELREVKAEERRGAQPTPEPPKRRSGYKITAEDRAKAKLEAVPTDPSHCDHPKAKRRQLGWGTLCGVCNVSLSA